MVAFSLGTVWEEMVAFMRREHVLLVPVALALFGPAQIMLEYGMAAGATIRAGGAASPSLPLLVLPAAILVLFGNVATTFIVLAPGISVAEGLANGLKRLPMALLATLLMALGMMGVGIVIVIIATVALTLFGINVQAPSNMSQLASLVLIPIMILAIRMLLLVPVASMEQGGVVEILRRAWRLSSGNVLRFVGVGVLVVFLNLLVGLLDKFVIGSLILLIGQATGASELLAILQLLITAALEALLSVGLAVYIALVYRTLAAPAARS